MVVSKFEVFSDIANVLSTARLFSGLTKVTNISVPYLIRKQVLNMLDLRIDDNNSSLMCETPDTKANWVVVIKSISVDEHIIHNMPDYLLAIYNPEYIGESVENTYKFCKELAASMAYNMDKDMDIISVSSLIKAFSFEIIVKLFTINSLDKFKELLSLTDIQYDILNNKPLSELLKEYAIFSNQWNEEAEEKKNDDIGMQK